MSRRNRLFNVRTLVLGGLAVAAAAGAVKNRQRVAGLIGSRSSTPEPYPSPSEAPPGTPSVVRDEPAPAPTVSNYDAPGPPANTATPIPAPEAVIRGDHGIDEAAEEAAAAREAANIGGTTGTPPQYASDDLHETADEAHRPLEEAGQGVAEGFEQAEAELVDNAEPAAGDPLEGQRQLEDVLESTPRDREELLTPLADQRPDDDQSGEPGTSSASTSHLGTTDTPGTPSGPPDTTGAGASLQTAPLSPESADQGAPTTGGTSTGSALGETATDTGAGGEPATSAGSSLGETPAAEKSSAVWRPESGAAEDQRSLDVADVTEGAGDSAGAAADPKPDDVWRSPFGGTPGTPSGAQPEPETTATARDTPDSGSQTPATGTTPEGGASDRKDGDDEDDGGSEWQTWSGRAVEP